MTVEVHIGDCRAVLAELPTESVNCVVTSPPYWGLRDYGLEPVVWGGSENCSHEWQDASWKPDRWGTHDDDTAGEKQRTNNGSLGHRGGIKKQGICRHCNAWLGSLGLEPTPELYVEHMTAVFRGVRRVLRADGTCWLNLGDSYAAGGGTQVVQTKNASHGLAGYRHKTPGIKPKDLVMIPARVALALQADGWYLRSDIIWAKPNPMPESVRDRPTKSYEHVFLLAKSERYFYDAAAVEEPAVSDHGSGNGFKRPARLSYLDDDGARGSDEQWDGVGGTRNLRDVWTIPTAPYPEAHFATFPPALVEPCIKAGCPAGGVVLDPFAGSGTVGEVARRFGCSSILIEAQPKYRELIDRRLAQGVLIG